jgi:hypothetical protein
MLTQAGCHRPYVTPRAREENACIVVYMERAALTFGWRTCWRFRFGPHRQKGIFVCREFQTNIFPSATGAIGE